MAGVKGRSGGVRPGQGRPPKATQQELIERLSPMEDSALEALKIGIASGEFPFIKLYFEYRFGKPKDSVDITSGGEKIKQVFNIGYSEEPEDEI